ncbi:MAG TPA: DUF1573 domain-containing protein [Candidatus Fraserbacteria bacterium]|nr:DUF1573 domain-containing protein [Candidatus Fraserbacteria bacterium]
MTPGPAPLRRRLLLAVAFAILIAALAFYSFTRLGGDRPPQIAVSPSSYDFGQIPLKLVQTNFEVTNVGDQPLEILKVSTSCGCTKATISKRHLKRGEHARLHVTLNPTVMDAGEMESEALRIVYIKSNDPDRPEVEIELRGVVAKPAKPTVDKGGS